MHIPQVNYLAVLVTGFVIFALGGLWYSPVLFAKKWVSLMGKTEEDLKPASAAMPISFVLVFICGLLTALAMSIVLNHFTDLTAIRGAEVALV